VVIDRLAFRIAWPFALLAAALAGAVGWDAARRAGEGAEQRLDARMADAAELLARLPGAYEQERLDEIGRVLGLGVAIRDFTGEVRHTLRPSATRDLERALAGPQRAGVLEVGGERHRAVWGAVRGPVLDALVLLVPEHEVAFELERARAGIGALTAVAVLAAVVLAAFIARGVARPLAGLVVQTRRVAAGELDARIAPRGPRELRELAASFNAMAASLARSQAELDAAREQALLGRMATGIAHEIRNPLTSIRMAMQLAAEQARTASERADLEVVVAELDRIDAVAGELLLLGRPMALERADTDLRELVVRALKSMAARVAHRGVALAPRLPDGPLVARVDAGKITQLLVNLVLNALDASPAGASIEVELAARDGQVELAVRDAGPGVADPERLFEPFFSTKAHGTGLGLATSRKIARAHGGDLVHEPLAVGSRFAARWPATHASS